MSWDDKLRLPKKDGISDFFLTAEEKKAQTGLREVREFPFNGQNFNSREK